MGFTSTQVDAMDLPELRACLRGFTRANSSPEDDEPEPPTSEQFAALVSRHRTMTAAAAVREVS